MQAVEEKRTAGSFRCMCRRRGEENVVRRLSRPSGDPDDSGNRKRASDEVGEVMIGKEKLLKKIHEVVESKSSLVPLLERHIASSLAFSGLDPVAVHALHGKCQEWMLLQLKHVEILKEMAGELRERKIDVF